jgi:hypothetical protein
MGNKTYKKHGELRGRKKDKLYKKVSKRNVRRDKSKIEEEINSKKQLL